MKYKGFRFNPLRDKSPVSSVGFVDLRAAMVNNAVPSQVPGTDDDYNGIDIPDSILGKPRDIFEAMDMQAHINNFTPPSGDEEKE